jgi:hypothetical protein
VVSGEGKGSKKGLAGLRAMGILGDDGVTMLVLVEWVQEYQQKRSAERRSA